MPFPASIALAVLKAKTEITENNKDDTYHNKYDYNYDFRIKFINNCYLIWSLKVYFCNYLLIAQIDKKKLFVTGEYYTISYKNKVYFRFG